MSAVLLSLAGQIEDLEFKLTGKGWESISDTVFNLEQIREDLNEISTKKKCEEYYQKYVTKAHTDHKILVSNYNQSVVIREKLQLEIQLYAEHIPNAILAYVTAQNDEHLHWYKQRIANSEKNLKNLKSYDELIQERYGEITTKQLYWTHKHAEQLEVLEETKSEQFQKLKKLLNIDD